MPGLYDRGRQLVKSAVLAGSPKLRRLYEELVDLRQQNELQRNALAGLRVENDSLSEALTGAREQHAALTTRASWMADHLGQQFPNFAAIELSESQKQVVADFQDMLYLLSDANGNRTFSITWFGYEMLKWPSDIWLYQEMIVQMKPDVIIETGTNRGGSALFLACICELIGHGEVVTIDIDASLALQRPRHPRIHYLAGSSVDAEIVKQVTTIIDGRTKVLVSLDSSHTREHVLEELNIYSRIVTAEGLIVVEDSHVNGHPTFHKFGPGPWEAIEDFLAENDEFYVDRTFERFLVTANPNGYLRRKVAPPLQPAPVTV